MKIEQFDIVKIRSIKKQQVLQKMSQDKCSAKAGDIATILEVFQNPVLGYELECSDSTTGETIWLSGFKHDEIELEILFKNSKSYVKKLTKGLRRKLILFMIKEFLIAGFLGTILTLFLLYLSKRFSFNHIYIAYGLIVSAIIILILSIYFYYQYAQAINEEDD